jgi:hypothetical protein
MKSFLIMLLAISAAACEVKRASSAFRLIEKGPYQALYGSDGRLQRLVYDGNGDGRAEVVTIFGPSGQPLRAEIDSDNDGVADRWEYFSTAGSLERVGISRRRNGKPDEWDVAGPAGAVVRREFDEDGDGRVDRAEDVIIEADAHGDAIRERRVPVRR